MDFYLQLTNPPIRTVDSKVSFFTYHNLSKPTTFSKTALRIRWFYVVGRERRALDVLFVDQNFYYIVTRYWRSITNSSATGDTLHLLKVHFISIWCCDINGQWSPVWDTTTDNEIRFLIRFISNYSGSCC